MKELLGNIWQNLSAILIAAGLAGATALYDQLNAAAVLDPENLSVIALGTFVGAYILARLVGVAVKWLGQQQGQ